MSVAVMQSEWMTLKEVCVLIRRSASYVYKLTRLGEIPCHKPDGKLSFLKAEVLEWWANRKKGKQFVSVSKFQEVKTRHRSLTIQGNTTAALTP